MARIIGEIRPRYVFVENSPKLISNGLDRVLSDFAKMGYNATWGVFSACSIGASHTRERLFLLAHADQKRLQASWRERGSRGSQVASRRKSQEHIYQAAQFVGSKIWEKATPESAICGVADGVPGRIHRVKALGNSQIPAVVELAFTTLTRELIESQ